jgi:hypothetical protein
LPHGRGQANFSDGVVYAGQFKDGYPDGQGQKTYPDGTQLIGKFTMGKAQGYCTYLKQNGYHYQGEMHGDLRHGQAEERLVNGSTFTGTFENGRRKEGTCRFVDGSIYEG